MARFDRLVRLRVVPWLLLFEAARSFRAHLLEDLSPADRRRIGEILRSSHGNPLHVTAGERQELRRLAGKLDVRGMARELAPVAVKTGRARRGGRRR